MDNDTRTIRANLIDLHDRRIYAAAVAWSARHIVAITTLGPPDPSLDYLLPGFIDAHVHVESTMLTPAEFGRIACRHGTVAAVSDPHEIANILGTDGVHYMASDAQRSPIPIHFGAPACVPATAHETSGAELRASHIEKLLSEGHAEHLAEVMDFPGVLEREPGLMAKIDIAKQRGRRVDGHAPGLTGDAARRYADAGIDNDHECATREEAEAKLAAGMHLVIREGSAAKNFAALHPLIDSYPQQIMFCTDDLHPDDLVAGHINRLCARAIAAGHDRFDVLRAGCINPVRHYRLPVGQLRVGDRMDAVLVDDPDRLNVLTTWVAGNRVAEDGNSLSRHQPAALINRFNSAPVTADALTAALPRADPSDPSISLRVIECRDGALDTSERRVKPCWEGDQPTPDPGNDVLMLAVVNRYRVTPPAVAFIRGFGLNDGAIAGSIAHDSHNVIAVGSSAQWVAEALNRVIDMRGGIAAAGKAGTDQLPLPVAGLMSDADGDTMAHRHEALVTLAQRLGTPLTAPFMTLSFMALLVIPALKLSDRGLFDGERFAFVPLLDGA
ncbi:adenine deaminase [Spiribacter vilamensis]|uniref:Adenine deaminase n=1 Tax=Spiribacter vilamensis TaxID=531306 RepID=A0A4Q8CZ56_9GAMM|nr:adenine deaminase [Spiribacter vilamensis]RZU98289.1 adenine deaminase [Spiribacter vilamensis]TVO60819.1 adenine deaminase [Spiribacter vilamensis]